MKLVVINGRIVVKVNFSGQVCAGDQVGLDGVTVTDDSGTPGVPGDDQIFNIGSLNKSACAPYSGSYFPSTTFTDDPQSASFTDIVTAEGEGRFNFGHVEASTNATCPLCP